jgi:hypothetical protein
MAALKRTTARGYVLTIRRLVKAKPKSSMEAQTQRPIPAQRPAWAAKSAPRLTLAPTVPASPSNPDL